MDINLTPDIVNEQVLPELGNNNYQENLFYNKVKQSSKKFNILKLNLKWIKMITSVSSEMLKEILVEGAIKKPLHEVLPDDLFL